MARGRFITFEGGEGCGKSTQTRRLGAALERMGVKSIVTREPGGTPLAESVRRLLKGEGPEEPCDRCELLLFLAVFLVDELCCEGIVAVALIGHEEGAEGADAGVLMAFFVADAAELAVFRQCVSLQLGCHVVADDIEGTAPESNLLAADCRVVAPLKHLVAVGGIAMHHHIACIELQLALIDHYEVGYAC